MPNSRHIITGFGGPDGQYSWISENVEEILGLQAEQLLEHRPITRPLSVGTPIYDEVLAEERQRQTPRLTFRSWLINVDNTIEAVPLAVIALFLRDDDGELEKVFGAAWRCNGHCPICSQTIRSSAADMRRAVLGLGQAAAVAL